MSAEYKYICYKCGRTYSLEDYLEDRFCKFCGSILRPNKSFRKIEFKGSGVDELDSEVKRFFPYPEFRPHQKEAILFAYSVIKEGKIGLLSSPCGTGKSISILTAYFMSRSKGSHVGRLLALTRTKSQLEIYCRELRRIKEKAEVDFTASIFVSKRDLCPILKEKRELENLSYRDFLRYCRGLRESNSCSYYLSTIRRWRPTRKAYRLVNKIRSEGPLFPEELYIVSEERGLCPYEVNRILTRYADIIVGNYNYVLSDPVRNAILNKVGIGLKDINCIFDEAHNLPSYSAHLLSDEISTVSIERAIRELEEYEIDDSGLLESLMSIVETEGEKAYRKFGVEGELLVEVGEVVNRLISDVAITHDGFLDFLSDLMWEGERIRYRRMEEGKRPTSYLYRVADFLDLFVRSRDPAYIHYVRSVIGRNNVRLPMLGLKCLDPSLVTKDVLNELRSAILMSGTLWHMDYYIDVLGIDRSRCEELKLPSPFPTDNRVVLVDKAVTTKFEMRDEQQWSRIANRLEKILEAAPGRAAVYFPSYEIMRDVLKYLALSKPALMEEGDTKLMSMLDFLKGNDECVIFGVARGKMSEGIDMSLDGKSLLSMIVIVGLPFPKKTEAYEALKRYFKRKFGGKAPEYASVVPCVNAMAQAAGRLLRSPEDRGIIVIMDRRAAGRFRARLPAEWRTTLKAYYSIDRMINRVRSFKL